MPTPSKGGYLYFSKGCRDSRHPSLVIPDAGVSRNVSPLPDLRITEGRYLVFRKGPDLTSGKGRCTLKRGIL